MYHLSTRLHSKIFGFHKKFHSLIDISSEVKKSLNLKKPIVALESTIITHGMPYPQNIQTAIEVEDIVRTQVMRTKIFN